MDVRDQRRREGVGWRHAACPRLFQERVPERVGSFSEGRGRKARLRCVHVLLRQPRARVPRHRVHAHVGFLSFTPSRRSLWVWDGVPSRSFGFKGGFERGPPSGRFPFRERRNGPGGSPPDVGSGRRGWSNPHLSFRSGKRKGRRKRFDPDIPFPLGGGGKERGTPESPTHLVPPRDTMKCVPAMDEARRREGGTNRWKWNTRPGVEMERQTLTRW